MLDTDPRIPPITRVRAAIDAAILELDAILLETEDTDERDAEVRWDEAHGDIDAARHLLRDAGESLRDALAYEP